MKISTEYRNDINGLRGLAILAVVIFHFNKAILPGGYLGVDIFFIISGYVISSSIFRGKYTDFWDFTKNFYKKRIKRLLPALSFFVFVNIFISAMLIGTDSSLITNIRTGISSLFGLSNFYLIKQKSQYFSVLIPQFFKNTWSLGVEAQFYFIFPFILWFSGILKFSVESYKKFCKLLIILGLSSFLIFIFLLQINVDIAYYALPSRFWEISLGCLVFFARNDDKNSLILFLRSVNQNLLLALLLISFFLSDEYLLIGSILSTLATSIFLLANQNKNSYFQKILSFNIFQNLGLISYSVYLWHWSILSISRLTIGIQWWTLPIQIFLILSISIFSYKNLELNRKIKINKYRNVKDLIFIPLSLISAITLSSNFFKDKLFLGNRELSEDNYSEKLLWNYDECTFQSSNSQNINKNTFSNCWIKKNNKDISKNLFIYGDSFTGSLAPAFSRIGINEIYLNKNIFQITGCPSNLIDMENYRDCKNSFLEYLKFFEEYSGVGDYFIIFNSAEYFFKDEIFKDLNNIDADDSFKKEEFDRYKKSLIKLAKKLNSNGKKLFVISTIPSLNYHPEFCIHNFSRLNNYCNKKNIFANDFNELNMIYNNGLSEINTRGYGFINIYDFLIEILIKDKKKAGEYYFNSNHLNKKGSLLLLNILRRNLI